MYLRHEADVSGKLRGHNTLCLRFRSLNTALQARRPRPRWRTKLIDHAQLRWVRTTLIGRMPGWHEWAKCVHAVGPWQPILLVTDRVVRVVSSDIQATVQAGTGRVAARIGLSVLAGTVTDAMLHVGNNTAVLAVSLADDGTAALIGTADVPDPALWWPHTHGGAAAVSSAGDADRGWADGRDKPGPDGLSNGDRGSDGWQICRSNQWL